MVTGARAVPLCFMGRFAEGLGPVEAAVEREPHDVAARYYLGVFSATGGRFEFARQQFDRIDREGAAVWGLLGDAYARSLAGDRDGARQAAENRAVVEIAQVDDQFAWQLAQALAHAGHHDAAMTWLRRATDRGFAAAHFVNQFDQMLAPLRGHAEWRDLLAYMERRRSEIAAASGFND
jgi:hypothetical protein